MKAKPKGFAFGLDKKPIPEINALTGAFMYITTTGIVLRETLYKESSKILTFLTASHGKITVSAKGARRRGSKTAAATQFLAFSELTLCETRGRFTLTEARSLELFEGLRQDIELLSLGSYFAEALEATSDEDSPGTEILSLGLNALFALAEGKRPPELVKAAFETRLAALAGFEPMLDACAVCGKEDPEAPSLSLNGGALHCRSCRPAGAGMSAELCRDSLFAMRYIISADPKRVFSFTIAGAARERLCRAAEAYLLAQLGHSFRTLDFYRSIKS